jgi:hypothetical protein
MTARFLALLVLLLPVPAAAQSLEGSWALELDGATIFRFDIARDNDGEWQGTWTKPGSFASDGNNFAHVSGPPKTVRSMTGVELPDGLELSFADPRPGAVPDIFDFKPIDANAVEMTYVGTGLAPYTLQRVEPGAALGPWDPAKTYSREAPPEAPEATPKEPPPADPDIFKLPPGAPTGR